MQAPQDIHRLSSVEVETSVRVIASTGQMSAQVPQTLQVSPDDGFMGTDLTSLYGKFPLISSGARSAEEESVSSFSRQRFVNSSMAFRSLPSGRSVATSGKMEWRAMNAPAPTTKKPLASSRFCSSSNASSYSRFP